MVMPTDNTLLLRAAAALRRPSGHRAYYDRDSDTLTLSIDGPPRPALNVPIVDGDDVLLIRWDRGTDQVVGIEVEGFLAGFAERHPVFAGVLRDAELRGISRQEAREIAARIQARTTSAAPTAMASLLEHMVAH